MDNAKKIKKGRPRVIYYRLVVYDSVYNIIYEKGGFVSEKQAKYYFYHCDEITHYYKWEVIREDKRNMRGN